MICLECGEETPFFGWFSKSWGAILLWEHFEGNVWDLNKHTRRCTRNVTADVTHPPIYSEEIPPEMQMRKLEVNECHCIEEPDRG